MADRLLHFAVGMTLGVAVFLPAVCHAWQRNAYLSRSVGRMILASLGLGGFAVIPSVLARLGLPVAFCRGWWMNVFVLHPLLDRLRPGGMLIGEVATIALFCCQYVLILIALKYREKQPAGKSRG